MAPDQTVRGGENVYPILSGNSLPKVPKFSVITGNFRQFFLRKKRESALGRIELMISRIPIPSSTPRPLLLYKNNAECTIIKKKEKKIKKELTIINKELKINKKEKTLINKE